MDEKFIGTVTITTEEYRTLIEEKVTAEADCSKANSRRWEVEREFDKAKDTFACATTKLDQLSEKYERLMAFIKADETIYLKWLAQLKEEALGE